MRVMVMVKATKSSEAGQMPPDELFEAMAKYNEALVSAGIMRAGDGLKPTSAAKRVHFHGNQRTVIDGPFAETKELIAGYWLWEVESIEEAVQWVKRCPNPMLEDSDIDIRPLYEMDDFAQLDPKGIHRDQEQSLQQAMALQQASVQPYLFFAGRCEEAIAFYQNAVGAKLIMKMRFNESPDEVPDGMLQAGFQDKIMHASFTIGKMTIMASDGCDDRSRFDGFRLALSIDTVDAARSVFTALAQGGKIDLPLGETFWSPCYGMLTDKFNVGWMVMVPGPTP